MLTATLIGKLAPAAIVPVLALLSGTTGYALLKRTSEADENYAIALPWLCILCGGTLIGLAVYCLSLAGCLSRTGIVVLLAAQVMLAAFNLRFFGALKNSLFGLVHQLRPKPLWAQLAVLAGVAYFLYFIAAGLASAIVPNLDPDTASTYLNSAKLFLQYGGIIDVGHFVGNMGKTGFLELAYGMGLESANLAHAWLFILAAVGIWLIFLLTGFIAGFPVASLLLTFIVSSSYAYESIIVPAKFDGMSFALSAAIACMLYLFRDEMRRPRVLAATAVMNGFLAGLSYNNVFASALFFGWTAILLGKERGAWRAPSLALLGLTVAGAAPTYIHNFFLFGNPVYPFASAVFGTGLGVNIPADSFAYAYIKQLSAEFAAKSPMEALSLLSGMFSDEYDPGLQSYRDPYFGFALAAGLTASGWLLVRAAILRSKKPIEIRAPQTFSLFAAAMLWILYLAWAFTQHIIRYLSAAMPLAFIAIASLFAAGNRWDRRARGALLLDIGTCGAIMALLVLWSAPHGVRYFSYKFREAREWLSSGQGVSEYVESKFVYGSGLRFGQAVVGFSPLLKPGDKVLSFINGNYYFPGNVKVFLGNGSNALPSAMAMAKPLSHYADAAEWVADLRSQGFCCIVLDPDYLYLSAAETPVIAAFLAGSFPDATLAGTGFYYLR